MKKHYIKRITLFVIHKLVARFLLYLLKAHSTYRIITFLLLHSLHIGVDLKRKTIFPDFIAPLILIIASYFIENEFLVFGIGISYLIAKNLIIILDVLKEKKSKKDKKYRSKS